VRPVEGLCGTALVTRGGSVEADLAEGLADLDAGVPCTSQTRFQLSSVTKQFTAAAVMLLVESGQLDLHTSVDRWLPQGPAQWRHVTLHHLLSHTAGVPHWREAPGLDPAEPIGIDERLGVVQATPLRSEPGAEWHYSSPGFLLAGLIVKQASGQPLSEFLAERILSPLKLIETTIGGVPEAAAKGYNDGEPVESWDLDAMPGTGDIWSTVAELTRFTVALHSGELLSENSLRAMCRDTCPPMTMTNASPGFSTPVTATACTRQLRRVLPPLPPWGQSGVPVLGLLDPADGIQHRHPRQ